MSTVPDQANPRSSHSSTAMLLPNEHPGSSLISMLKLAPGGMGTATVAISSGTLPGWITVALGLLDATEAVTSSEPQLISRTCSVPWGTAADACEDCAG